MEYLEGTQKTHTPNMQEYEITISVKVSAQGQGIAKQELENILNNAPNMEAGTITSSICLTKPADSDKMTSDQELDYRGGRRIYFSPINHRKLPANMAYRWTRMMYSEWKTMQNMFCTTTQGKDKLSRDVSEVWQVEDSINVWIKMFKAVNQK